MKAIKNNYGDFANERVFNKITLAAVLLVPLLRQKDVFEV